MKDMILILENKANIARRQGDEKRELMYLNCANSLMNQDSKKELAKINVINA